ncbi:MAG TPA: class I SAM-dependent methyltransferase [Acidimicrobiales bacterium]|nr:class I SAM-dependent methyltransferase [Acidimicrobiales bacterium]
MPCRQPHTDSDPGDRAPDAEAHEGSHNSGPRALTLGSIEWNRAMWGDPSRWEDQGNNWSFHAESCGQPYVQWKASVVATFIAPFCGPGVDVLELAPGHGRWTEYFVGNTASLTLVDLNASCISVCQERFGSRPEVRLIVNDGRSLPVPDASVDLVWCFGTFVHLVPRDIDGYLGEFRRVLRPGGRFVVHHTGWPDATLRLVPLTRRLGRPGRVLQHRLSQGLWRPGGDRVEMSARRFAAMAGHHGLVVDRQVRTWGSNRQYGLAFNDVVSVGSSPG